MKPEDLLPRACARANYERSESLRKASAELRIVSETLRAEAEELMATSRDIRKRAQAVMEVCMQRLSRKSTSSPQAVHSLSTGKKS